MIHILWPTIRPNIFLHMHKIWMERADYKNITTHVCVNTKSDSEIVRKGLCDRDKIIIINSTRTGVCQSAYALSSSLIGVKEDIVVFASDDFMPPQNWSGYIIKKIGGRDVALFCRDGYQLPDSSNMIFPSITIPIMTYGCLEKLNKIIYNPCYYHMFSDCELYLNLKELNLLVDDRLSDFTTFEHLHHAAGKRKADDNDIKYHQKWKEDESTWNIRRFLSVEERIKIDI